MKALPTVFFGFFIFSICTAIAGFAALSWTGFFLGLVFSLGVITYSYFYSDHKLKKTFQLKKVMGTCSYKLNEKVAHISQKNNITPPLVYVSDQPYDQAFCFGRSYRKPKIAIFSQLLNRLNEDEISTLLHLLLSQTHHHQQIGPTLSLFIIEGIYAYSFFVDGLLRFLSGIKLSKDKKKSYPFTHLISPLLQSCLALFQQRALIYASDTTASRWLQSTHSVHRLLNKIHAYSLHSSSSPAVQYCHIFITSPLTSKSWGRYLVWQPNIINRTKKLAGHYPA